WTSELLKNNPIVGLVIGVLVTLFGVFQMLAPVIIAVTTVLSPLVSWFIRLISNGGILNGVLAILRGAMTLLAGPVGIVISVLTALSAIFIMLYPNVE